MNATPSEPPERTSLVDRLSPALSGKQRRHLRALGHPLKPVVLIGQRGISENLIGNIEAALETHELIKIKVHDADALDASAEQIHQATGAQLAQRLGRMLLFYRARSEGPTIVLPRAQDSSDDPRDAT